MPSSTAAVRGAGATPVLMRGLLDDAALFPPGNAPMNEALARHAEHRSAPYAEMVGPFICSDVRWSDLTAALAPSPSPLDVSLVVSGGPSAIADAVQQALSTPGVRLVSAEVPVGGGDDSLRAGEDALDALQTEVPPTATGFVEVPLSAHRDALLALLAGTPVNAKLRTGGTTASAFPDEETLARALLACLRRDVSFKLTAGLHNAVRHRDATTGFEHHGFLNVMLAVAAGLAGDDVFDLAAVLALQDADEVSAAVMQLHPDRAVDVRRRFLSFGTCSIDEPVADLASLRLLTLEESS